MLSAEKLQKKSIETELCCRCGVCAGVCPVGAISIDKNGVNIALDQCVDCGLCDFICPAEGYTLSDFTCEDVKEIPKFSACAQDIAVSDNASSGGFVTQTLLSMLEKGDITAAAVVVTGDNLNEASSKYIVTSQAETILEARRSKYTQASIDTVLQYIKQNEGRYAIVGLPCQLYAVTKAMERVAVLRDRIAYKIGMVCGYTYDEVCMDGLLKVMNLPAETVESVIGWREGGLPGNFSVRLKNGDVASIPFATEHSVDVTYFAQNRCLLCKDCLCEYGDVVCADIGGWSDKKTLVLVRNQAGRALLDKMEGYGSLHIEKCAIAYEKTVLPFMLREKRAKVELRIKKRRKAGLPTTKFAGGYVPKLLLSQKIEAQSSLKLQARASCNRHNHSAKKMLKIGRRSYCGASFTFFLKVLFKLQVYTVAFLRKTSRMFQKAKTKFLISFADILPTRTKPLKATVIGLGQWGSQYLTFLKCSKYFKLVAAYDSDREKLDRFSKKYGFQPADSIEDVCKDFGAQVQFVLTPTPTHSDVFRQICKENLPVYMEKPIADNLSNAQEVVDLARTENALLYVAHSMKYEPSIQKIKEILESGALGQIAEIKITRTVKDKKQKRFLGAPLYQIGVHLIDVLYYLLGDISENANIQATRNEKIENVLVQQQKMNISLQYGFGEFYNFSIFISGQNGYILLANGELKTVIHNLEEIRKIPMKNEMTVYSELKEFYDAVTKKQAFLNTMENAEKIIAFCQRIIAAGEL